MIKFTLACENEHRFESWFQNGAAYDLQVAAGLVACPICGTHKVAKAVMAPAIAKARRESVRSEPVGPQGTASLVPSSRLPMSQNPVSQNGVSEVPARRVDAGAGSESAKQVALLDTRDRELRAMITNLRARILAEADDVGERFPEEARKMHDGLVADRPIHGQASVEDARALLEEGIEILPIPVLPDEHN